MAKVNTTRKVETPSTRRGAARREALLLAAREIFLEKGYAAASVEDVVGRVGGSKATLYSYFGSKEGLFGDMIASLCDQFVATLEVPHKLDGDIEQTLTRFAKRLLKTFMDPERVAMHRTLFAEITRFPELAERIYESGQLRGARAFSNFLRLQHEAGLLHCPDPARSAVIFTEMIKADPQRRALLGLPAFKNDRELDRYVANAVQIFLHGCLNRKIES
ncbi:MAG: TetR/AcrR family transcriptional regulator [Stenotrophobium sp.]